jgi:hypothetical protein
LEDWSLDLVTPSTECIRKDGACIIPGFPDAPDQVYSSPTSIKGHLLTTPQGKFYYLECRIVAKKIIKIILDCL